MLTTHSLTVLCLITAALGSCAAAMEVSAARTSF
jgi:hypothetical protein